MSTLAASDWIDLLNRTSNTVELHNSFTMVQWSEGKITLSHGDRSSSKPTRAAPVRTGEVASTTCKDIRIGISASALVDTGSRQPSRGMHGRARAQTHHA